MQSRPEYSLSLT